MCGYHTIFFSMFISTGSSFFMYIHYIHYAGFFLCTFTTTTGSDNFRKPEFFPSRTWVFFGRTWVFSWMDLSFPQIDKRSCQIWSKTPFPGRFWVVFHWFFSKSRLYTILCELKTPENSAFEENSTWVFSKTWVFSGTWVFQVHKKSLPYMSLKSRFSSASGAYVSFLNLCCI